MGAPVSLCSSTDVHNAVNDYVYMQPNNLLVIGLMAQSDWNAFM